jgi:hypothetical protein
MGMSSDIIISAVMDNGSIGYDGDTNDPATIFWSIRKRPKDSFFAADGDPLRGDEENLTNSVGHSSESGESRNSGKLVADSTVSSLDPGDDG